MQAQHQLMTPTRQLLITAAVVAFLAVMAMVPAVRATSFVPVGELVTEEASAQSSATNIEMIQDQIQFLEANWHFGAGDAVTNDEASDNPAAAVPSLSAEDRVDLINELRSQNVADFEAMERAPGLYTASPDAASPTGDASLYAGLSHDEMQFLEDNWHLDAGVLMPDDEVNDESESRALTRDEIQFNEDNWDLNTGEAFSGDDTDETASAPTSGNNAGRSHDELTYPWGGYLEHDY